MVKVAIMILTGVDGNSCMGCDWCDAAVGYCDLFKDYLVENSRHGFNRCQMCRDAQLPEDV